jgi:hypothetical protein
MVFFDWDRADITREGAEILDRAAEAYRTTGYATVVLGNPSVVDGVPPVVAAELTKRRLEAVSDYLEGTKAWTRVVQRNPGGAWLPWSPGAQRAEAAPVLLLGPLLPAGTPSPSIEPPDASEPPAAHQHHSHQLPTGSEVAVMAASKPLHLAIPQIVDWSVSRTLRSAAYNALIAECERLEGSYSAGCADEATNRQGLFRIVPEPALREFQSLLGSCANRSEFKRCVSVEWQYRSLPVGSLDPQPRKMVEGHRTLFTAFIRDRNAAAAEARAGGLAGPSAAGNTAGAPIPYADRMCFLLKAEPRDFRIEPDLSNPAPRGFSVDRYGEMCMDVSTAGGADKYQPSWWVTPLRAGDHLSPGADAKMGELQLMLSTKVIIGGQVYPRNFVPYPIPISIVAEPTGLERVNAFLSALTETAVNAGNLAKAISALITAVLGWGVWSLFKARRRGGSPP